MDLNQDHKDNMFGAAPYLQEEFGLSRADARSILTKWMETF